MVTRTVTTAEELWAMRGGSGRHELWAGRLVEMPPPASEHGVVALNIGSELRAFARARGLGTTMVEAGALLQRDPDTVVGPDVSFYRADRLPRSGVPRRWWEIAPDIAVEVRSPHDSRHDLAAKVGLYLRAGTRLVWIVDPARRLITVHAPGAAPRALGPEDVLDGGEVLPGFAVRVGELFELGL